MPTGALMIGCRACDWDGCASCYDASRESSGDILKGSACWYKRPDGTYAEAQVESVDYALTPPSYLVKVQGSARETERDRLRLFLPLEAIWARQTGQQVESQQGKVRPTQEEKEGVTEEQRQRERLERMKTDLSKLEAEQQKQAAPVPATAAAPISAPSPQAPAPAVGTSETAALAAALAAPLSAAPLGAAAGVGVDEEEEEEEEYGELAGDVGEGIMGVGSEGQAGDASPSSGGDGKKKKKKKK